MSGGSFEYLYAQDERDIWDKMHVLHQMRDELAALGYAQDAAQETESLILVMQQAEVRIRARLDRLSDVWHAMEWWRSCDSSEDDLKAALIRYRGEGR